MNLKVITCAALCVLAAVRASLGQTPLGTVFTYQGQLKQSGGAVNAMADFEFKLFGALTGGTQIGTTQSANNVNVVAGLFTVSLNFGTGTFNGDARFLEIAVRSPAGSGTFTTLTPRQPLTAVPYALYALTGPGSGGPWTVSGNNVFNTNTGNVGVGTSAPISKLHVNGDFLWGGTTTNFASSGEDGLGLYLEQRGNSSATSKIRLQTSKSGDLNNYSQFFIDPNAGFSFMSLGTGNRNVGIGTTTPGGKLDIQASDSSNVIFGRRTGGGLAHNLFIDQFGNGSMQLLDSGAVPRINLGSSNHLGTYFNYGNVGIGTTAPATTLDVNGTTRTKVLEITGADLAEKFPTTDPNVEPGTVMEIDTDHAGQLRVARTPYSAQVAGVVSGAGDLPVGAVLGNLPGNEKAPAIALSGRVWVLCDASENPIAPGHLLTTSATPGHAMKAADRERSHGAVLGKAMTGLERGRGLVLVLVSLQ